MRYYGLGPACLDGCIAEVRRFILQGHELNVEETGGDWRRPLDIACHANNEELVRLLLDHGCDPDFVAIEHVGSTTFDVACATATPAIVEMLLQAGANPHRRGREGATPLLAACTADNVGAVRVLLSRGVDPNTSGCLDAACLKGSVKVVRLLCESGANPTGGVGDALSPLQRACEQENVAVARTLLLHGGAPSDRDAAAALRIACNRGNAELVALLLQHGADANADVGRGQGAPPLYVAAERRRADIVALLLGHGAEVDARDSRGYTPLAAYACSPRRCHEVVLPRSLLEAGADPNVVMDATSPLLDACTSRQVALAKLLLAYGADANFGGGQPILAVVSVNDGDDDSAAELLGALIAAGARVDARTSRGKTPLMLASDPPWPPLVTLLLRHGAEPNARDVGGATALTHAFPRDGETAAHAYVVAALLRHGADANVTVATGETLLHLAAGGRHTSLARMLLDDGGADAGAQDARGNTPLHRACDADPCEARNDADGERRVALATLLLKHGADPNVRNKAGQVALHGAVHAGYLQLVAALLVHAADPNIGDREGTTPCHEACERRVGGMIAHALLASAGDFSAQDAAGRTPLQIACERDRADIVEAALAGGAGVALASTTTRGGASLLFAACDRGSYSALPVARALLARGADVDAAEPRGGRTPLHAACAGDAQPLVRLLLERRADANRADASGDTPLHVACRGARERAVAWLLYHGADVNRCDAQGRTPLAVLCRAALAGGPADAPVAARIAALLLRCPDARLDGVDARGETPLHAACRSYNKDIALAILRAAAASLPGNGVDVNARDATGNAPLHIVCASRLRRGRYTLAALLRHGADMHARNRLGNTPLSCACQTGCRDIVRILLSPRQRPDFVPTLLSPRQRPDLAATNVDGKSALHLACEHTDDTDLVAAIIADDDAPKLLATREHLGKTPLLCAAAEGHYNIVDLLVERADCAPADAADALELLAATLWSDDEERAFKLLERGMRRRYVGRRVALSKRQLSVGGHKECANLSELRRLRRWRRDEFVPLHAEVLAIMARTLDEREPELLSYAKTASDCADVAVAPSLWRYRLHLLAKQEHGETDAAAAGAYECLAWFARASCNEVSPAWRQEATTLLSNCLSNVPPDVVIAAVRCILRFIFSVAPPAGSDDGNEELVKAVRAAGAIYWKATRDTLLHFIVGDARFRGMASERYAAVVVLLLRAGTDIEALDHTGHTPLDAAVARPRCNGDGRGIAWNEAQDEALNEKEETPADNGDTPRVAWDEAWDEEEGTPADIGDACGVTWDEAWDEAEGTPADINRLTAVCLLIAHGAAVHDESPPGGNTASIAAPPGGNTVSHVVPPGGDTDSASDVTPPGGDVTDDAALLGGGDAASGAAPPGDDDVQRVLRRPDTCLHVACGKLPLPVSAAVLSAARARDAAALSRRDERGLTPLACAAYVGRVDVVALLQDRYTDAENADAHLLLAGALWQDADAFFRHATTAARLRDGLAAATAVGQCGTPAPSVADVEALRRGGGKMARCHEAYLAMSRVLGHQSALLAAPLDDMLMMLQGTTWMAVADDDAPRLMLLLWRARVRLALAHGARERATASGAAEAAAEAATYSMRPRRDLDDEILQLLHDVLTLTRRCHGNTPTPHTLVCMCTVADAVADHRDAGDPRLRRCLRALAATRDGHGCTALHALVYHDFHDLPRSLRLLLEHGCRADVADRHGNAPLHAVMQYCTAGGDAVTHEMAALLLAHGAHADARNARGRTARELCAPHKSPATQHLVRCAEMTSSLACLCATTVLRCGVPYRDALPPAVREFVEQHCGDDGRGAGDHRYDDDNDDDEDWVDFWNDDS